MTRSAYTIPNLPARSVRQPAMCPMLSESAVDPDRRSPRCTSGAAVATRGWPSGGSSWGPCFWRYLVIDMARELVVEDVVPVSEPVAGDGEVQAGVLPGWGYVAVAAPRAPGQPARG